MAQIKTLTNTQITFNSYVTPGNRIITLDEVAWHDTPSDCWIVIYDQVYDITKFLSEHPGGHDVLLECAGRDGTCAFQSVEHSKVAFLALKRFLIGQLPEEERIFKRNGFKLIGIAK